MNLFANRRILWQTFLGYYCLGLDRLCPIHAVTCADDSRTHDLIEQQTGIRIFSLERTTGWRTDRYESAMEAILPGVKEQVEAVLRDGPPGQWAIVSTNPWRSLAEFAGDAGIQLVAPREEHCAWLNEKVNFLAAVENLGLPRLPGRWLRLDEARYSEVSSEMGSRFVAQLSRGASGSGTFFISSAAEYAFAGLQCGEAPVWVAPDVGDLSLNINAIATEEGAVAAYPSVQLAGLSALSSRRGGYCGNDYAATADLPVETVRDVVEQTVTIGRWLASFGFLGMFGLDFVVDPDSLRAYAVDLNPRWQGSTSLLAQAQYKAGVLPLPVADLAYRMGLLSASEVLRYADGFLRPVRASHISLRNRASEMLDVAGDVEPGVYSFCRGAQRLRSGLRLEDLGDPGEMLVIGCVPRKGARIGPEAHMLRASSGERVMDVRRMDLLPWAAGAACGLYEALGIDTNVDAAR
jgi:hypothetical protein